MNEKQQQHSTAVRLLFGSSEKMIRLFGGRAKFFFFFSPAPLNEIHEFASTCARFNRFSWPKGWQEGEMCPFINGRGSATSKNSFVYFSEANIACPSETSIRPRGRLWSNFKGLCLVTIRYFLTSFDRGESAQHFETVPGWMRPMAAEISGGKSRQTRHVDIPQSDVTRNALAVK